MSKAPAFSKAVHFHVEVAAVNTKEWYSSSCQPDEHAANVALSGIRNNDHDHCLKTRTVFVRQSYEQCQRWQQQDEEVTA